MNRSITLEQSEAIVAACKSEAQAVGQPMNIAVVDSGGNLVAFAAMDDAKLIGEDIAQKKALTAVYFQMDTRDLAPLVQPGQPLYGIEATTGGRRARPRGAAREAARTCGSLARDPRGRAARVQRGQPLDGIEATAGSRLVVFGGGVLL